MRERERESGKRGLTGVAPMLLMDKGGHSELGENVCEQVGAVGGNLGLELVQQVCADEREDATGGRTRMRNELCAIWPNRVWVRLCFGTAHSIDGDPVTLRAAVRLER